MLKRKTCRKHTRNEVYSSLYDLLEAPVCSRDDVLLRLSRALDEHTLCEALIRERRVRVGLDVAECYVLALSSGLH